MQRIYRDPNYRPIFIGFGPGLGLGLGWWGWNPWLGNWHPGWSWHHGWNWHGWHRNYY